MNRKIQNYVVKPILALVAASCLAGCSIESEPEGEKPGHDWGSVPAYSSEGDLALDSYYIIDEDGDGNADIIQYNRILIWYAEGHEIVENYYREPRSPPKVMTPDIREAATAAMRADQRLTDLIR